MKLSVIFSYNDNCVLCYTNCDKEYENLINKNPDLDIQLVPKNKLFTILNDIKNPDVIIPLKEGIKKIRLLTEIPFNNLPI